MTAEVDTPNTLTSQNENKPNSPLSCLPWWDVKAIEAARLDVGNTSNGQQTYNHKHHGSVAPMKCVLETYDPNTYVDAQ